VYVMKFLGHKNIKNTLIYIGLERGSEPGKPYLFVLNLYYLGVGYPLYFYYGFGVDVSFFYGFFHDFFTYHVNYG